jgi:flagellar protein FliO/FliZ
LPLCIFSQTDDPNVDPVTVTGNAGAEAEGTAAQGPGTAESRAAEEGLNFFDETAPAGGGIASGGASSIFAILRMVLVLALVAGVIYLIVRFLKRMGKPQIEQNPHLKILASTHLGNGRYVHVVSVGKEAWLVGSGEGGVHHIAAIGDQEAVDAMALDASRQKAETPEVFNFQALVKKFSGGLSAKEKDRLEKMRSRREQFKRF